MNPFRRPRTAADKIAPPLARALVKALPSQPVPVIVRFRERARSRVTRETVVGLTITYAYTLLPALALQATSERIQQIAADPDVETVWLDLPVHTCLDVSAPIIGAPVAWAAGLQGRGITIGVVDTGVDVTHPDLAGQVAATRDYTGQGLATATATAPTSAVSPREAACPAAASTWAWRRRLPWWWPRCCATTAAA